MNQGNQGAHHTREQAPAAQERAPENHPPTEMERKRATMRSSIFEGSLHAGMEGFSDQFVTPYALFLGATTQLVGFLAAIPQLIASVVQLFSAQLGSLFSNRVRVITAASVVQALLWLPLLLLPSIPHAVVFLIGIVTAITTLGMFQSPIWNSIMGNVIPSDERGRYFGKRTSIITLTLFGSVFLAGSILNFAKTHEYAFIGFAIVFTVACLAKLASAIFKARMYDPPHPPEEHKKGEFLNFLKGMNKTNYGRFLLYMTLFKVALGFSGPFFAVLMLRDLHFTYLQFTVVTIVSTLTSFLTFKLWGRAIDAFGSRNVLLVNGLILPIFPLVWVLFPQFWILFATEAIAGVIWAGFNLATASFIFDATLAKNRTSHVAYFNFFSSAGFFLGATTAGILSTTIPIIPWIFPLSRIPIFLLISAALRLVAFLVFLTRTHESRLVEISFEKGFWNIPLGRSVLIMPSGSSVLEVGGRRLPFGEIPRPHHLSVHPKHFDHTHREASAQDEEWVHRFLEKSGTAPKKEHVGARTFKETLITDPMFETKEVDDILENIKKGKYAKK